MNSDLGNSGESARGPQNPQHVQNHKSHVTCNSHQSSSLSYVVDHPHQLESRESWLSIDLLNSLRCLKSVVIEPNPVVHCLLYICIWYLLIYLEFWLISYPTVFLRSENNVLTLIFLEDVADKKCEHEIKEETFSFVFLFTFAKLHSNIHLSHIPHSRIHIPCLGESGTSRMR